MSENTLLIDAELDDVFRSFTAAWHKLFIVKDSLMLSHNVVGLVLLITDP